MAQNKVQLKIILDSLSKLLGESDAWIILSVVPNPKSPRIVPGSAFGELVFPIIILTTLTASLPSKSDKRN